MGFLGDDGEDEVEIKASTQVDSNNDSEETELMNEVESKFGRDSSGSSSSEGSGSVSLEEVHRQNEKIISMLEELTGSKNSDVEDDFSTGDGLDGVL
jgi:hypothetical protein